MRHIKFYRYLLPYWKKEILIWSFSSAGFLLGLINPYLTKIIIDKAYADRNLKLFLTLIILAGIVFILGNIMNALSLYLSRYVKTRMSFDLNLKIFKKLRYLPYRFFQDTSTGAHLYKVTHDIENVSQYVSDIIPQIILLMPETLLIFGILLYLNVKVALFSLLLMPFVYLASYFFMRYLKKAIKIWMEDAQHIFGKAQEILSHMQLVKAFGRESSQARNYIAGLMRNTRLKLANIKLELTGSFACDTTGRIILGLIIGYGAYEVLKGRMTLGTLSAIVLYLSQLSRLQYLVSHSLQQISAGLVSCERLNIILDAQGELRDGKLSRDFMFPEGAIVFKDVTFGYGPDRMVLKGLNFSIRGGSCVGLVGPSGCGKTTIVNLILRLFNPLKGQILIDGADIKLIKSGSFYTQIGAVLQEPFLWDDTIENNIRYGRQEAVFEEIRQAAQVACIDDFINSLPDGYKMIIGENACKISEGQKQRIAIARAIIKRPKLLILDEALSSIDSELEADIIANIRNMFKASTIIVISHRLSTISQTDSVYFLSASDKIETDTHESLLRNNSQYPAYLAHQLQ
ncbi:MAG: ABC transporter ATP-binding protein [Candidatus Omnitrophica bacterium]|nr:ABC transporter ATP-binding protein [Candidatus Omnitrophota bacterium]